MSWYDVIVYLSHVGDEERAVTYRQLTRAIAAARLVNQERLGIEEVADH